MGITRKYEDEELLNEEQMNQIATSVSSSSDMIGALKGEVFATTTGETMSMWDKVYARAKLKDDVFHLSLKDTFLHSLCSDSKTADKIISILFSRYMIAAICLVGIPWLVMVIVGEQQNGHGIHSITWIFSLEILLLCSFYAFFILFILSCNIPAMLLIISGFDFWVKLCYVLSMSIAYSIYHHIHIDKSELNSMILEDLILILDIMAVIVASLIEGFGASWKICFGMGLLMSCIFTWFALQFTLFLEGFGYNEYYLELLPGMSFGLLSYIASALRVLSLFMWKQTLMAIYTRGGGCICVYISPQIKWQDD